MTTSGSTPDPVSTARNVQDQYLEAVKQGQEAFVNAVQIWSQNVQRMLGETPSAGTQAAGQTPKAEEIIDNVFGFAEQLLSAQKDFAKRLIAASTPTTETDGGTTTKRAASGKS